MHLASPVNKQLYSSKNLLQSAIVNYLSVFLSSVQTTKRLVLFWKLFFFS